VSLERIHELERRFRAQVEQAALEERSGEWPHGPELARELLESMLLCRHLDAAAHELKARGDGHYTICSSGHEANVVFGRLTRPSDAALLHYRSGALQIERSRHVPGVDAVRDIALSLVASCEDPISRGRHKVFGRMELGILPQTSTIASHLPRAVGMAFALERRRRLGLSERHPKDAIVLASFGDASLNHSTLAGALNTASWILHQRLTLPLLCVCEDNGLGISVRTPEGWIETRLSSLPHVRYFQARSSSLAETYAVARAAVDYCRSSRRAAVLHLRCVRLLGHAGSDVDTTYRSPAEIAAVLGEDPVLGAALELIAARALDVREVLALDSSASARVREAAEYARGRPKLQTRAAVMSSISRPTSPALAEEATRALSQQAARPLTLAQGINAVLSEALERYPHALLFGEDVAQKGGVYGITKGLFSRFGSKRVFNTLLDEQSIFGLALGAANLGLLPIPEIQYLAYLHNAEDQLRGEALTLPFFSDGAYDNPLLVRIAGLAYQKGFGGHFHNDNSLGALRDMPGLVVFVATRADDAFELYRTALALCESERRVVVALEPIALYHQRDLYETSDGQWLAEPAPSAAKFGEPRLYHETARDLLIVSYGNGLWLSLRVAHKLAEQYRIAARVLDLRWISPLPAAHVARHALETGRVLIVDECRHSGNVSEALAAALIELDPIPRSLRVTAADSFVPLGEAAKLVLVSEAEILDAALRLFRDR
jgi:2-oxoisovalerate dehydrogenase E1 component